VPFSHGVRGRNDQIRFDLIFQAIAPEIEIITPRDLKLSDKKKWTTYLKNRCTILGKKPNIRLTKDLGTRRKETLTSNQPLPSFYLLKRKKKKVTLQFEKGELVGVNGRTDKAKNINGH
jgi:argininosuccinate synthase